MVWFFQREVRVNGNLLGHSALGWVHSWEGGGACSGEPGVLHKPHGAPWPPGRRWTPSQRPGSRWPHLAMGFLGAPARAQVVLYILEYVLTYAPHPNSHGSTGLVSVSPLHLESSLLSGLRQAEVSRGGGNWQCPQPPSVRPGTSRSGHLLWVNGSFASSIS